MKILIPLCIVSVATASFIGGANCPTSGTPITFDEQALLDASAQAKKEKLASDGEEDKLCAKINWNLTGENFKKQAEEMKQGVFARCVDKYLHAKNAVNGGETDDPSKLTKKKRFPSAKSDESKLTKTQADAKNQLKDTAIRPIAIRDGPYFKLSVDDTDYVLGNPIGHGYGYQRNKKTGEAYAGMYFKLKKDGYGYDFLLTQGTSQTSRRSVYVMGERKESTDIPNPGYYGATDPMHELRRIMENQIAGVSPESRS